MAILNYTTKVSSDKTIAEIQKILVKHGAMKIVTDYDPSGIPIAVTFCLVMNNQPIAFELPANYEGVLKAMTKDKNVPNYLCNKDQALKVSWRIVKDWVEAQMAIVEAQLADIAEVFLPYAVTKEGTTLYKHIKSGGMKMLQQG